MKSHASFSTDIVVAIYKDATTMCDVDFDHRDMRTLISRTKHEGLQFLTVTLPRLGADLEASLESGKVDATMFQGFQKHGKTPRFLGVLFHQVFSRSGVLLDRPSHNAIKCIRQLAYIFKKPKEACREELKVKALNEFIQVEQELAAFQIAEDDERDYDYACRLIWDSEIAAINCSDFVSKHGPGATAERYSAHRKYYMKRWHERLEQSFPFDQHQMLNPSFYDDPDLDCVQFVDEASEQPVRVIAVPKTATKPRIIAIEPCCMQYTQQGVSRRLIELLETSSNTAGHINFSDQTVNQKLAMANSLTRQFSTIDLSNASDRVLNVLVHGIFRTHKELHLAIQSCRSSKAQITINGVKRIISLVKFASMGSALCFPIEAMVFYTICVMAIARNSKDGISYSSINSARKLVYVYGDDIIVPANQTSEVCSALESFGLKVNWNKSFTHGFFRESCGLDAYAGSDVTPVYMRYQPEYNFRSPISFVSTVSSANQLARKGYWQTFNHIKALCDRSYKLPTVGDKAEGLGWHDPSFREPSNIVQDISLRDNFGRSRWNSKHQHTEYLMLVPRVKQKIDPIGGHAAILKWALVKANSRIDEKPLNFWDTVPLIGAPECQSKDYTPERGALTLKRRWCRPY